MKERKVRIFNIFTQNLYINRIKTISMEKDQGGSECICIWPHFVSLHPLGVAGQLVPLGEGHDPLVDDPLVPGNHWTAPVHRRIVLKSAIML